MYDWCCKPRTQNSPSYRKSGSQTWSLGTIGLIYRSRRIVIKMSSQWYWFFIDTWSNNHLWWPNGTVIFSVPFNHLWTVTQRWTPLISKQKLHGKISLRKTTVEPIMELCQLNTHAEDRFQVILQGYWRTPILPCESWGTILPSIPIHSNYW